METLRRLLSSHRAGGAVTATAPPGEEVSETLVTVC